MPRDWLDELEELEATAGYEDVPIEERYRRMLVHRSTKGPAHPHALEMYLLAVSRGEAPDPGPPPWKRAGTEETAGDES